MADIDKQQNQKILHSNDPLVLARRKGKRNYRKLLDLGLFFFIDVCRVMWFSKMSVRKTYGIVLKRVIIYSSSMFELSDAEQLLDLGFCCCTAGIIIFIVVLRGTGQRDK